MSFAMHTVAIGGTVITRKTKEKIMAKKSKFIPFSFLPASWGLKGEAYQRAKIEYELDGIDRKIALAKVGGYEFVDAEGYDFTDFSDSKTASTNPNTNVVTISSIENKIGALRITCYNHVKQALDYFFVPSNKLHTVALACYGKNSHKQRIIARYNEAGDHYNQFEKFRIADFVTLAQTKG